MKTIHAQIRFAKDCGPFDRVYWPYTDEDKDNTKGYKINQCVTMKVSGSRKQRSIDQLNTYWKACSVVAEMRSDHYGILSKEDIDFDTKIKVAKKNPSMIKRFRSVDGIVYMEPISIAFDNMKHLEACRFFSVALLVMADSVGMTVDALITEAKLRMG